MKVLHDVHTHNIFSSCCSDRTASTAAFVEKEASLGNKIFGLANHIWDESVRGASSWYSYQTIAKAKEAKASLANAPAGLRCLFGAETEYYHCHDRLGMSEEGAKVRLSARAAQPSAHAQRGHVGLSRDRRAP